MNLWLLRPSEPIQNSPWQPWYDKAFGFVVRAETESDARNIAALLAGDEGCDAWLSADTSSCDTLTQEGLSGCIIRDFARG